MNSLGESGKDSSMSSKIGSDSVKTRSPANECNFTFYCFINVIQGHPRSLEVKGSRMTDFDLK